MEGPSLYLAQEQLRPFKKKVILKVSGNTKIEKERFINKEIKDIFSWGKHLLFQFDTFALKVHFLLYGTFSATIDNKTVTGDYKKARTPRLQFDLENGQVEMYNCSVKIIEDSKIKKTYDFTQDIMSKKWDQNSAYKKILKYPKEQIADVLLDQEIFSGVGNIIKNEVLSVVYIHPERKINEIKLKKLEEIIDVARSYSIQFYKWRKKFLLLKNLKIHRKGQCPHCGGKVTHQKTGKRQRWSHYCPICQLRLGNKAKNTLR